MKLILFIYFTILCCYIVRADIRDDIGIFLINGLKSIVGSTNSRSNIKSNTNTPTKDEVCAQLEKEISEIEEKFYLPALIEFEKTKKPVDIGDAINGRGKLEDLKKIITKSEAPKEFKDYIIKCSHIDEKIKILYDFVFSDASSTSRDYRIKKENQEKERQKQLEIEKNCVSCGEVTSFGNGRICCRGNVLKLSNGNYAYGVKTTGLDGITKCFCGTGRDCVNAQDCKQDNQICSDGFCVVGDRKSAIGWQELGHSRLGN
jgi:hypothetical protein